ncbi:hypothetical protein ACHAWF_014408 [Thalassiosira exigua]
MGGGAGGGDLSASAPSKPAVDWTVLPWNEPSHSDPEALWEHQRATLLREAPSILGDADAGSGADALSRLLRKCVALEEDHAKRTYDLVAHGARPLVDSSLVADNQQNRKVKETGAGDKPAVSYKTVEAAGQKAGNLQTRPRSASSSKGRWRRTSGGRRRRGRGRRPAIKQGDKHKNAMGINQYLESRGADASDVAPFVVIHTILSAALVGSTWWWCYWGSGRALPRPAAPSSFANEAAPRSMLLNSLLSAPVISDEIKRRASRALLALEKASRGSGPVRYLERKVPSLDATRLCVSYAEAKFGRLFFKPITVPGRIWLSWKGAKTWKRTSRSRMSSSFEQCSSASESFRSVSAPTPLHRTRRLTTGS